jgi:hypothetical protein
VLHEALPTPRTMPSTVLKKEWRLVPAHFWTGNYVLDGLSHPTFSLQMGRPGLRG